MTDAADSAEGQGQSSLIRFGGASIVVALGIHIVLNSVLKEFPPDDPTAAELQAYLTREAGTWAIVHGFRYIAFTCIVLFAAGLFSRTCTKRTGGSIGWGVVGLLGAAIWVTNGFITNGIEILAFVDFSLLAEREELFWLLFWLTRVLFTAELAAWSITILGFSVAGLCSATIPKWLAGLGLFSAVTGMLSSVFVVSVINGGGATILADVAALSSLVWFLCTGVFMSLKGKA